MNHINIKIILIILMSISVPQISFGAFKCPDLTEDQILTKKRARKFLSNGDKLAKKGQYFKSIRRYLCSLKLEHRDVTVEKINSSAKQMPNRHTAIDVLNGFIKKNPAHPAVIDIESLILELFEIDEKESTHTKSQENQSQIEYEEPNNATDETNEIVSSQEPQNTAQDEEPIIKKKDVGFFPFWSIGPRVGLSLQEHSVNDFGFEPGFILGLTTEFGLFRIKQFRIGVSLGYLYYSHQIEKGTDAIFMETKYNRFDATLDLEVFKKAFFVNARAGLGAMLISTDSKLTGLKEIKVKKHVGFANGFLAGFGIGAEIGKHGFGIKNEIDISIQADWLRRGTRDEFVYYLLITIQFASADKTIKVLKVK